MQLLWLLTNVSFAVYTALSTSPLTLYAPTPLRSVQLLGKGQYLLPVGLYGMFVCDVTWNCRAAFTGTWYIRASSVHCDVRAIRT